MKLLSCVYNIVYFFAGALLLIYSLFTNNKIIKAKLFFKVKVDNNNKKNIWIHGSSVGEVLSCQSLIGNLNTNYNIIITTNTKQGYLQAQDNFQNLQNVSIYYLPYDISFLAKNFTKQINASLVLWLEQDFFINFFKQIKKNDTPLILLNARMSNKSYSRYLKLKPIINYILHYFNLILPASSVDYVRYSNCTTVPVEYIGNLKYTNLNNNYNKEIFDAISNKIKFKHVVALLSTHNNEEEVILSKLIKSHQYKDMQIIIAPRHIDRAVSLQQYLNKTLNLESTLLSKIKIKITKPFEQIIIVDSMGLVNTICKLSTVVYMGKSLLVNNKGGHNILEPMYMQTCTVTGPYMDNFLEIFNLAKNNNSIMVANNVDDLVTILERIIQNKDLQNTLKQNCTDFFKHNNILNNTLSKIQCYIS